MVCMADNLNFPAISQLFARQRMVGAMKGVLVDIYFSEDVSIESHEKAALSINLWQPNLRKDSYPVYKSNGKEIYDGPKTKTKRWAK